MDKYEYKLKTEQMLKLMEENAFSEAAEIADVIDWKRVRNIGILTNVAEIYERNREYQKSYDVLKMAYHRAQGSRKIIYRLCILALKTKNVDEAIDYYDEFVKAAPKDPNKDILQYQILRAQHAPIEQQIKILEHFKRSEYIEKWAYELAKLYQEAGMTAECLEECDDLILWFSDGKYVYQAMELKMQYKPLTPSQQEKYNRRNNRADGTTEEIPNVVEYKNEKGQEKEAFPEFLKKKKIGNTMKLDEALKSLLHPEEEREDKHRKGKDDEENRYKEIETGIAEMETTIEDIESVVDLDLLEKLSEEKKQTVKKPKVDPDLEELVPAPLNEDSEVAVEKPEIVIPSDMEEMALKTDDQIEGQLSFDDILEGWIRQSGEKEQPEEEAKSVEEQQESIVEEEAGQAGKREKTEKVSESIKKDDRLEEEFEGAKEKAGQIAEIKEKAEEAAEESAGEHIEESLEGRTEESAGGHTEKSTEERTEESVEERPEESTEEHTEESLEERIGESAEELTENKIEEKIEKIAEAEKETQQTVETEKDVEEEQTEDSEEVQEVKKVEEIMEEAGNIEEITKYEELDEIIDVDAYEEWEEETDEMQVRAGIDEATQGMDAGEEFIVAETAMIGENEEYGTPGAEEAEISEGQEESEAEEPEPGEEQEGHEAEEPESGEEQEGREAEEAEPGEEQEESEAEEAELGEEQEESEAEEAEPGEEQEESEAEEAEPGEEQEESEAEEAESGEEQEESEAEEAEPGEEQEEREAEEIKPGEGLEEQEFDESEEYEELELDEAEEYEESEEDTAEEYEESEGDTEEKIEETEEAAAVTDGEETEMFLSPEIQRLIDEIEGVIPEEEPETDKSRVHSGMKARSKEENMGAITDQLRINDILAEIDDYDEYEEEEEGTEETPGEMLDPDDSEDYIEETKENIVEKKAEETEEKSFDWEQEEYDDDIKSVKASLEEEFRPQKDYEEDVDDREIPEDDDKINFLSESAPLSRKETAKLIATGKTSPLPMNEISDAMSMTDTGFIVHGRYDLKAQSGVGTRAGLTEEQKKLFSYFVPVRGMSEQLVDILEQDKNCTNRKGSSRTGNLLIIGNKGNGKTVLAVDVVKAIQKQRNIRQGKVAIVTGESLNKKKISDIFQKLHGGALIIEKAGKLDEKTVARLNRAMEQDTGELFVVLEDQRKPLDRLLTFSKEFRRKFTSRLEVPVFVNDELVTFGQTYAQENGYRVDEMGILALYSRIDLMQREDHAVTVAEVKEIMDEAIARSQKASAKKLMRKMFGRNTDEEDRIILSERDFNI